MAVTSSELSLLWNVEGFDRLFLCLGGVEEVRFSAVFVHVPAAGFVRGECAEMCATAVVKRRRG